MEFKEATEAELSFATNHSLHGTTDKGTPERIDYVYTLKHEENVLGVGGFRMITDTTAWAWIEPTEFIGGHLVPTYRVINEYMAIFCKNHGIRRLQAWVEKGFSEGMRTVRHCGFEEEYMMKDFLGKGRDAILFVRYFGE